ncbi:MAG TPA: hypothetical protein VM582_06610, partial [Candidatus Thermoplasmatota archaeon]|nr:hypothetical protein [Candidatus Thermoplasmatota archaeon]
VVGAGLYANLLRRVSEPRLRFRIAVVSTSIIVWFTASVSAYFLLDVTWFQVLNRSIGVAAALAIFAAYRPPHWLERRLRLATPAELGKPVRRGAGGGAR